MIFPCNLEIQVPDGSGHQKVTPKHKQPQSLGLQRSYSCLMDPFHVHPRSFLALASLGEPPRMSQRGTCSPLLTAVASLREDMAQLTWLSPEPAVPRSSRENQPQSKHRCCSHTSALDGVLDSTPLSHYKMCLSQLVFGLTFPISPD